LVSAQRLTLCRLEELDLLAGLLLECGDGLLDRRVLLGIDSLVPPNDEVSAPGTERRQDERYGKNDGPSAHSRASPGQHRDSAAR
jgi:hypothetical protein